METLVGSYYLCRVMECLQQKNIENYTWSTTNNSIIVTTYFSFIPVGGFEVEF